MLTVKEWMELVDYRITEGDSYGWQCFGTDAFSLSAWNGDQDGWSMNMVFDTATQTVYVVEICDYARDRAYRMINPDFKQAHDAEARDRGVNANEAWDAVNYVDLDVDDDFIQKGLAIREGEDYDIRVKVKIELPDDVLFQMMTLAHERDITLNQLVEIALQEAIDQHQMLNDEPREEYDFSSYSEPIHFTNTDNPIDFPVTKKKKKGKK